MRATRCQILRLKCTKFDFRPPKGQVKEEKEGKRGKGGGQPPNILA